MHSGSMWRTCALGLCVAVVASCLARPTPVADAPNIATGEIASPMSPTSVVGTPPAELLGTFEDDYGSTHRVSASAWRHGTHSTYEVQSWHSDSQYFIARNAASNRSGGGLYTRIDWMQLRDMAPYTMAFCLSAYEAITPAEAEAARVANRSTPKSGCNGFPFSRLKPMLPSGAVIDQDVAVRGIMHRTVAQCLARWYRRAEPDALDCSAWGVDSHGALSSSLTAEP